MVRPRIFFLPSRESLEIAKKIYETAYEHQERKPYTANKKRRFIRCENIHLKKNDTDRDAIA